MATETAGFAILTPPMRDRIAEIASRYPSKKAATLPALHLVLETYRCVPYRAMAEIAALLDIEPAEVSDTMSFYGFFPQAPLGVERLWICRSISCALRGGEAMLDHACRASAITPGETTADGALTIEFAECFGLCDFAPAALVDDGRVFGPLESSEQVDAMLRAIPGR